MAKTSCTRCGKGATKGRSVCSYCRKTEDRETRVPLQVHQCLSCGANCWKPENAQQMPVIERPLLAVAMDPPVTAKFELCVPRWATEPTGRESMGVEIASAALDLGHPLMPWQRLVADVGGELEESGLPAYREIIITVPRQSGKTTLELAWEVQRALMWPLPQRIAYTAQTGWDARRKLIDDQAPLLRRSSFESEVERIMRGSGNEAILFHNGSRIDVLASTEAAGHGRTIDLGVIDEAWADDDDRREQSLLPAMVTRPAAQIIITSTAGTSQSTYLRRKVEAGRAAVDAGDTSGIAYFEWSADEEADADDPDIWWSCMPALGHTITEAVVEHARVSMTDGEFRRSYLNQWTTSEERVIPNAVWLAVCSPDVKPVGDLVLAADATPDRDNAAIVVADRAGRGELIDHRAGTGWVADRLTELASKHNTEVVLDVSGPLGGLIETLSRAGRKVYGMQPREVAYASGSFYDRVADGQVSVRSHPSFDNAVAGAQRRSMSDGWVWARRSSNVDVSPLVALTLAVHRASRKRVSAYEVES